MPTGSKQITHSSARSNSPHVPAHEIEKISLKKVLKIKRLFYAQRCEQSARSPFGNQLTGIQYRAYPLPSSAHTQSNTVEPRHW